jgi:hypothetical protein
MTLDLDALRAEHRHEVIGEHLRRLLHEIAYATARQYPPRQYGAGRSWSREAVEDLLHDWVADRLIKRRHLAALIASAASLSSLKAGLTTDLRQYLANRHRKSITAHLFHRMHLLLSSDPVFVRVGPAGRAGSQRWALEGADNVAPSTSATSELLIAARELRDADLPQVWYKPSSQKTSPVLRNPELKRMLEHLLGRARGSLTLAEIARAVFQRFDLEEPVLEELDDSIAAAEPAVDELTLNELVGTLVARLGKTPLQILAEAEREGSARAAAARLGISEGDVLVELGRIGEAIEDEVDSAEEAQAAYRELANRCSKEVWR